MAKTQAKPGLNGPPGPAYTLIKNQGSNFFPDALASGIYAFADVYPNYASDVRGQFPCGRICLGNKKINFSQVFAGQAVGIKEVHDDIWLVSFMEYDLGYFDLETRVLEPLENPFGPKVLPMS
jgi:hypothetical protein